MQSHVNGLLSIHESIVSGELVFGKRRFSSKALGNRALEQLCSIFTVEGCAYAVMRKHYQLVDATAQRSTRYAGCESRNRANRLTIHLRQR
jgi:hypothetical protein